MSILLVMDETGHVVQGPTVRHFGFAPFAVDGVNAVCDYAQVGGPDSSEAPGKVAKRWS